MNDLLWKGVIKGASMYLDSERNPTMDYLIRSLRIKTPLEPKDNLQNAIRRLMLGKVEKSNLHPTTRNEILEQLNVVDDPKRLLPLMYYYTWTKYEINEVKKWKKEYLFSDIEIPLEEEIQKVPVDVDFYTK